MRRIAGGIASLIGARMQSEIGTEAKKALVTHINALEHDLRATEGSSVSVTLSTFLNKETKTVKAAVEVASGEKHLTFRHASGSDAWQAISILQASLESEGIDTWRKQLSQLVAEEFVKHCVKCFPVALFDKNIERCKKIIGQDTTVSISGENTEGEFLRPPFVISVQQGEQILSSVTCDALVPGLVEALQSVKHDQLEKSPLLWHENVLVPPLKSSTQLECLLYRYFGKATVAIEEDEVWLGISSQNVSTNKKWIFLGNSKNKNFNQLIAKNFPNLVSPFLTTQFALHLLQAQAEAQRCEVSVIPLREKEAWRGTVQISRPKGLSTLTIKGLGMPSEKKAVESAAATALLYLFPAVCPSLVERACVTKIIRFSGDMKMYCLQKHKLSELWKNVPEVPTPEIPLTSSRWKQSFLEWMREKVTGAVHLKYGSEATWRIDIEQAENDFMWKGTVVIENADKTEQSLFTVYSLSLLELQIKCLTHKFYQFEEDCSWKAFLTKHNVPISDETNLNHAAKALSELKFGSSPKVASYLIDNKLHVAAFVVRDQVTSREETLKIGFGQTSVEAKYNATVKAVRSLSQKDMARAPTDSVFFNRPFPEHFWFSSKKIRFVSSTKSTESNLIESEPDAMSSTFSLRQGVVKEERKLASEARKEKRREKQKRRRQRREMAKADTSELKTQSNENCPKNDSECQPSAEEELPSTITEIEAAETELTAEEGGPIEE